VTKLMAPLTAKTLMLAAAVLSVAHADEANLELAAVPRDLHAMSKQDLLDVIRDKDATIARLRKTSRTTLESEEQLTLDSDLELGSDLSETSSVPGCAQHCAESTRSWTLKCKQWDACRACAPCPAAGTPNCYRQNLQNVKGDVLKYYEWIGPGKGEDPLLDKKCRPLQYNVDAMSAEVYRFGWKGHPEWEIRGECVKDAEGHYNAKVRDTTGVITSSAYSQCLTATDVGKSSGLIKVEACNVNFKNPLQHFELYTEGRLRLLNTNKCIEYKGKWKSEATGEAILSDCSSKREQKFEYIFTTAGRAAIAGKPLTEDQDGRPKVKEGMGVDAIGNFRLKGSNKCITIVDGSTLKVNKCCRDHKDPDCGRGSSLRLDSCAAKYGMVSCPCAHRNGKKLTLQEAQSIILGQVAMLGFVGSTDEQGGQPAWDRMRIGLATFKMLNCWRNVCASGEQLLQLKAADAFGGGSSC